MKKTSLITFFLLQSLYALPLSTSKKVESVSKQYLGDPYVWGGVTQPAICYWVVLQSAGPLP